MKIPTFEPKFQTRELEKTEVQLCQKFRKMRKTLFILLGLTMVIAACKKYEPQGGNTPQPVYPKYEIGDYFKNDTLEGVVFFTTSDGSSGLMVGFEETLLPWCINTYINEETGASNPYEGWNNTNILISNYDLNHYPVVQWSHQKNTWFHVYYDYKPISARQWYVPSSNELRYLLQNQNAVNATLSSLGYPTLEDKTYWSSTETGTRGAAAVRVQNDQIVISDSIKTLEFYVRVIRNF